MYKILALLAAIFVVCSSLSTQESYKALEALLDITNTGLPGTTGDNVPSPCDLCLKVTHRLRDQTTNVTQIATREMDIFCTKFVSEPNQEKCRKLSNTALESLNDLMSKSDELCAKLHFCSQSDMPTTDLVLNQFVANDYDLPQVAATSFQVPSAPSPSQGPKPSVICQTCNLVVTAIIAAVLGPIDLVFVGLGSLCVPKFFFPHFVFDNREFSDCIYFVGNIAYKVNAPLVFSLDSACGYLGGKGCNDGSYIPPDDM